MSDSTDSIVAAGRTLAARILRQSKVLTPETQVKVSSWVGCNKVADAKGFTIRIDRSPTPSDIVERIYHAAAHYVCAKAGTISHSSNGRHTKAFDAAVESLGAHVEIPESPGSVIVDITSPPLTRTTERSLNAFMRELERHEAMRSKSKSVAYSRATLICPSNGCTHTLTLRKTAIDRTRFLCIAHGEEMVAVRD
jgi:hypothetical protein